MMKSTLKITTWSACAAAVLVMVGCAGGHRGPSDADMIMGVINDSTTALLAQDIEKATMAYADDFEWDQGGKQEYVDFLMTAKQGGFLEDMEVNMENTVIAVEGDTATAGPVVAIGAFGELVLHFDLAKRDGQWVIVRQRQEM